MKISDLYKAAYTIGIEMDPRGESEVKTYLKNKQKKYDVMTDKEKKFFDVDNLVNPYSDTRINHDSGKEIKAVMVGIDMEVGELVLADRLNEKGMKIDAIIAHHPSGLGSAGFNDVMNMQSDIFNKFGVNISVAENLMSKRITEVSERFMPANHYRASDAAKLLNISMMNMHTPCDNCVATHLQDRFDKEKPKRVSDIMDMLFEEPEYTGFAKKSSPPVILTGDKNRRVNRVFVDMTGGTEGPHEIYKQLADKGVDTIVGMHFSADHKKAIQDAQLNCIIAGHISSDSLGINVMLDKMMKKLGSFKVYEASGFMRCERNKKK
ncbi:MAG: NGG1p interacting factor NIF3 [bacterium]